MGWVGIQQQKSRVNLKKRPTVIQQKNPTANKTSRKKIGTPALFIRCKDPSRRNWSGVQSTLNRPQTDFLKFCLLPWRKNTGPSRGLYLVPPSIVSLTVKIRTLTFSRGRSGWGFCVYFIQRPKQYTDSSTRVQVYTHKHPCLKERTKLIKLKKKDKIKIRTHTGIDPVYKKKRHG